jgi:ketosteroid isomerase-like protein
MNTTANAKLNNLDPFFQAVRDGLKGLVNGDHFFEMLDSGATYEFRYRFPGIPEKITGRKEIIAFFEASADAEILERYSGLVLHQTVDPAVVILEYEVYGKSPAGKNYDNRFCSVITIKDRKIVYWRDYCDSLTAMNCLGKPE